MKVKILFGQRTHDKHIGIYEAPEALAVCTEHEYKTNPHWFDRECNIARTIADFTHLGICEIDVSDEQIKKQLERQNALRSA